MVMPSWLLGSDEEVERYVRTQVEAQNEDTVFRQRFQELVYRWQLNIATWEVKTQKEIKKGEISNKTSSVISLRH